MRRLHLGFILLVCTLMSVKSAAAEKNYTVTSISFGGYQTTDGKDTVTGSQLAVSFLHQFTDHWAYFARLSNGSASGQHTEDGETYDLSAKTTTLTGGIQWSYDLDINSDQREDLTPFVGLGVSVQSYEYDFDYDGSDVGKTSGTGYGPVGTVGLKISISSNVIIIPAFHYEQISVKTADGANHSFISAGYSFALVARF